MGGNNEFFENFERNKYLKKLPSMQRVQLGTLILLVYEFFLKYMLSYFILKVMQVTYVQCECLSCLYILLPFQGGHPIFFSICLYVSWSCISPMFYINYSNCLVSMFSLFNFSLDVWVCVVLRVVYVVSHALLYINTLC